MTRTISTASDYISISEIDILTERILSHTIIHSEWLRVTEDLFTNTLTDVPQ